MPTQDTNPSFLGGLWGNARNAVRDRFRREVNGARNAVPGTQNWQWQQSIDAGLLPGNWYNSQNAPGDRWLPQRAWNNVREGFQGLLGPREPAPADPNAMGPPSGLSNYNHMPDPNAGPPRLVSANESLAGFQRQEQARIAAMGRGPNGAVGANRYNGTIAQGPAAVNMARSFAPTGLGARGGGGASSYGRDRMNAQRRMG